MRITKKPITAAVKPATIKGTMFYSASIDDIIKAYSGKRDNVWVKSAFENLGFDAIDFDHSMYGSRVIDDTLYICVTDGKTVDIDSYEYEPEKILDEVNIKDIEDMIEPASDDIIKKHITEYEIFEPKYDDWASDLLKNGTTFEKLVKDYDEFDH